MSDYNRFLVPASISFVVGVVVSQMLAPLGWEYAYESGIKHGVLKETARKAKEQGFEEAMRRLEKRTVAK
jgi:hypothetical protein